MDTSALADFQQALYTKIINAQPVTAADVKRLEGSENRWVEAARVLGPNNLVLRQYVLLDYVHNTPGHFSFIMDMFKKITFWKTGAVKLLWGESYSYWLYTKPFFVLYCNKFGQSAVTLGIYSTMVDRGFQATSYLRGSVMYPAPFGDLRDEPLEAALQYTALMADNVDILPVSKKTSVDKVISYTIQGIAVGYNGHIQVNNSSATIVNGVPTPFTWYTGYANKYPDWWSQLLDMANIKRILSFFHR